LIFAGTILHTHDGYNYYKVPVAHGTKMVEGSVAETCKGNKMMARFRKFGCYLKVDMQ
jgi:hypothetical protein